jgi:hypothetical protein
VLSVNQDAVIHGASQRAIIIIISASRTSHNADIAGLHRAFTLIIASLQVQVQRSGSGCALRAVQ